MSRSTPRNSPSARSRIRTAPGVRSLRAGWCAPKVRARLPAAPAISATGGAVSSHSASRRRPISVRVVHRYSKSEPSPKRFRSLANTWESSRYASPVTPRPAHSPRTRATPRRYHAARREQRSDSFRRRTYRRTLSAATGSRRGGYHTGKIAPEHRLEAHGHDSATGSQNQKRRRLSRARGAKGASNSASLRYRAQSRRSSCLQS